MNNKESELLEKALTWTNEAKLREDQRKAKWEKENKAREKREEEAFQKKLGSLERDILKRAKEGYDWELIQSIEWGKDIDSSAGKEINYYYKDLKPHMVKEGELKRILDHFQTKGFRIIFGHHFSDHDVFDPYYDFVAISWGKDETVTTSIY